MRHSTKALPVAALLAIWVLALISGCRSETRSAQPFPQRTGSVVFLAPADKGEKSRILILAPDRQAKRQLHVEFKDGRSANIYFRADKSNTVARKEMFYPPDKSGVRKLKSVEIVAADGKKYQSQRSFRPDGTIVTDAQRQPDGTYDEKICFADGRTVSKHMIFSATRDLTLMETSYESGSRRSVTWPEGDKWKTTSWYGNGKVQTYTEAGEFHAESRLYRDDGTVRMDVVSLGPQVTVEYFAADGTTPTEKRIFEPSHMAVFYYDQGGKPALTQYWANQDFTRLLMLFRQSAKRTAAAEPQRPDRWYVKASFTDKYQLERVEEMGKDGNLVRIVRFGKDAPVEVIYIGANGMAGRGVELRGDGTVEHVEYYNETGDVVKVEKHSAAEQLREKLDPEHFKRMPYEEPPAATMATVDNQSKVRTDDLESRPKNEP